MPRRPAAPPSHVRQWFAKKGQLGGIASAEALTPAQRSAKASAAASARWAKARGEHPQDQDQGVNPKLAPTPQKIVDTTITIPDELLERLDALQARMGLPSRQSAAEVLIRAGLDALAG